MKLLVLLAALATSCAQRPPEVELVGGWRVWLTAEPLQGRMYLAAVNGCSLCGIVEIGTRRGYVLDAKVSGRALEFDLDDGRSVSRAVAVVDAGGTLAGTLGATPFRATPMRDGRGQEPN